MLCDVEVQYPPSVVTDDEKAVENAELHGGHWPPDHRLGRDDYENLFPSGAKPSRPNPEEPIEH
jgi:hypothetical protein